MLDAGLLLIRVVVGLVMMAHGAQKLFGWANGPGLEGFRGMMRKLNVHPSKFWATVGALNEFGGGLLLLLGLLMPLGPLMVIANMLVAIVMVHGAKGFWNSQGGYEWPLTLAVVSLAVALTGPGRYALDPLLGISLPPAILLVGLGIVFAAVLTLSLMSRQQAPAPQAESRPARR